MKLFVDPISLGIGLVLLSFTLPSLFSSEMCNVNFVNENGVEYEKTLPCEDVESLTKYSLSVEQI